MSFIREVAAATLQPFFRSTHPALGWDDYLELLGSFSFDGHLYPLRTTITGNTDEIAGDFSGLVQSAYKRNGIVFACELARISLFSEARFQFRQLRNGTPGDLFGTPDLAVLEKPWPNATTGDLLARMLLHADLGGNAFPVRRKGTSAIRLPRPDWVTMVLGSMDDPSVAAPDIDAELIGIVYHPGGRNAGNTPEVFVRGEFGHFAPIPDPESPWRGMSWLSPVVREIQADSAATQHKIQFFRNGATPNMVVSLDKDIGLEAFNAFVEKMDTDHKGLVNAYKTLYLGGGAKVEVVGKDLQQLEFKATQGAGETRIAAASGMHPVIVPLSEGMQGSSLNSGNFAAARRIVADKTLRPLWRNVSGSLEAIVPPPEASQLWFDERDIAFLREDLKDSAEIQNQRAQSIRTLVDAGYDAVSVVTAVESDDFKLLKHSGLFSVQLQPPMTSQPAPEPPQRAIEVSPPNVTLHFDPGSIQSQPVTISEGAIRSEVTVEAPPPAEVRVEAPITVEPQVVVPEPKKRRTRVTRDDKGQITGSVEE